MLSEVHASGRLIRRKWSDVDAGGRQLLCLYTALVGDPGARPHECPASVCPRWLAHLLPWISDAGTESHWRDVVARVVELSPRFGELRPEVEYRVRAVILREALRHVPGRAVSVHAACARVIALCDRTGSGQDVSFAEWVAPRCELAEVARAVPEGRAVAWEAWSATHPEAGVTALMAEAIEKQWLSSLRRFFHTDCLIDAVLDVVAEALA